MQLTPHPAGGVMIGISDVLQWRDCGTRAEFSMRRHTEGDPPESWSPQNAYGTAIHDCLEALDDGATPDQAAGAAMARFKQWLEPGDLSLLHEDMRKYMERQMTGVKTLLNEGEISVKLFVHPVVGQVYFRARIDRLYVDRTNPAQLIHLDFKSSRWAKSHEEVAKDLQLWCYNFAIDRWYTDLYPEVEGVHIQQVFDQLRYGEVPTQKGPAQRAEIERWLIAIITAIIDEEAPSPSFNEWCPWCPLLTDCPVVQFELTDWAQTKIAALMPREEKLNKDGSVSKRPGKVVLDRERIREYVELLPQVKRAAATLDAFNENVTDTLKQMPMSDLHQLGKKTIERSRRVFTPESKRRIVDEIGLPSFIMLADVSLAAVERFYEGDDDTTNRIKDLAEKLPGATLIVDL